MSNDKIVIKGKFTGYYSLGDSDNGPFDFHKIKWDKIIINSFERIDDYNANELKLGNYIYFGELKNFFLETNDKKLIKQDLLKDVVFKNIEIIQSVKVDGIKYVKAKGDIYARTPYSPPVKINKEKSKVDDVKIDSEVDETNTFVDETIEEDMPLKYPVGSVNTKESSTISPLDRISGWFKKSWINKANNNYYANSNNSSSGCNNSSSNGGCLTFVIFLAGIFFIYAAFNTHSSINSISFGLFGLYLVLASFIPRLRSAFGSIIGLVFFLYIIISVLSYVLNFVDDGRWQDDKKEDRSEEETQWDRDRETEEVERDNNVKDKDSSAITYYQHNHNWKENSGKKRNSKFRIQQPFFNASKSKRNNIQANPYNPSEYWHKVYSSLLSNDRGKLDDICNMYKKIGTDNNLNYNDFADMVVTSIQWIPYVLVLEKSCEESKYDGGFVTEYLLSGKPCLGNIKFGIQSPVEFMSNFKGDCDTRSVLCFMILDKFGYDVAVLISEQYGHAILGINLNSGGGDYVKHRGKRYYVWETTATGFKAGNIPPGCSNLRYWKPALTNN